MYNDRKDYEISTRWKKIVFHSHSNKNKYMKNSGICATYTV